LLPQNNATHPAITSALEIVLQLIKIHENLWLRSQLHNFVTFSLQVFRGGK
jgi:hypothetical protein